MDSKSISRKGVGVQVPAPAPGLGFEDPLARALLPVLLHRVANATQHLNGLTALLAVDPKALGARGGDLADTSERVDEIGWLLALVASAHGAELLLARRERRGLRPLVACVRECLRREGRDLLDPVGGVPDLAPDVAEGWQVPWTIGTWLLESGRSLPSGRSLAWRVLRTGEAPCLECEVSKLTLPPGSLLEPTQAA